MLTRPADHMPADSRLKHWGKLFSAKDFNPDKEDGYALGGKFVRWADSVALGEGEFLAVAAELGSRNNHSYHYALVMGGAELTLVRKIRDDVKHPLWQEYLDTRDKCFDEKLIAKARNSTLYGYGLFALWMSRRAEGGTRPPTPAVDLSGVPDEDLAAELVSRGWQVEREPDGSAHPVPATT